MSGPSDPDDLPPEPANLRFLRRLVTTLTAVMICGLLVIVGLFVIRFSSAPAVTPAPVPASLLSLPDHITLPQGVSALAFTAAAGWYAVVTDDDRILIYDSETGALRQSVEILP